MWPYLPHAHSYTQIQTHVRVAPNACACCRMPMRSFFCCQLSLPIPAMLEKMPKNSYWQETLSNFNSHKCTQINSYWKKKALRTQKNPPKRHLASSGKERLEWKRECSPEAWWIDERREGERVKASWRQRRPCLVVGWVREGGSFGLLRDRQASFS